MSSRFSYTSNFTKIIIIVEFLLVSYLLYSLTKNVYNSYNDDKFIEAFEKENAMLSEENRRKNEDYLYFTSEEYIDKIAKQNLGLVNPGEEVIVLASDSINFESDAAAENSIVDTGRARMSNSEQWLDFFFGQ